MVADFGEGWEEYDPRRIVPGCIIASIGEDRFYTSFVIEVRQIEESTNGVVVRTVSLCSTTRQLAYFYYDEDQVTGRTLRMLMPGDET